MLYAKKALETSSGSSFSVIILEPGVPRGGRPGKGLAGEVGFLEKLKPGFWRTRTGRQEWGKGKEALQG